MKTYEITLAEQDAIPGHSPAGVVPMSLCFRDVDQDDDFYVGLFGPPSLLEEPATPEQQQRVCAWIARTIFEADTSETQAQEALDGLMEMDWAAAYLPADVGGKLCVVTVQPKGKAWAPFEWPYAESFEHLADLARAEHRQSQLEAAYPEAPGTGSRFRM
jgi:hypothetical protein